MGYSLYEETIKN